MAAKPSLSDISEDEHMATSDTNDLSFTNTEFISELNTAREDSYVIPEDWESTGSTTLKLLPRPAPDIDVDATTSGDEEQEDDFV